MTEEREIPAKHLHSMVTLLDRTPLQSLNFVKSMMYYIACWKEGKVDSSPNGPVWHDDKAEAEYRRLAGEDDVIDGDIVDPPALNA